MNFQILLDSVTTQDLLIPAWQTPSVDGGTEVEGPSPMSQAQCAGAPR